MTDAGPRPLFRFAPSPNGLLHLGHAYSALLNDAMAARVGGRVLLRIEDIDAMRSRDQFADAIIADLAWLGLRYPEPRRQNAHIDTYASALATLQARGLLHPCSCTRSEIERMSGGRRDPDGAPLHRGACRAAPSADAGERAALRLDMAAALAVAPAALTWREFGEGVEERRIEADPGAWGDVVLRGKDRPASYHLAVVVDDAMQGITDVVRGRDLYQATSIHRLLQELLGLPPPLYRHHRLVRDASGAKMSKSARSQSLSSLRDEGVSAAQLRGALGFGPAQAGGLRATIS
jgi:glutamyl-Q tRNA(Asp) synthetase